MKTFLRVVGLSFIWLFVWAFFVLYLQPQKIDYINHYIITSLYFLLVIVFLTTVFREQIGKYVDKFTPRDLLAMSLFSLCVVISYHFIELLSDGSVLSEMRYSLPQLLQMDEKFLITKSFEIMFQQTFFMISIYYLFNDNISDYIDMLIFGLYTMIIHIPVLFIDGSVGKILFAVSFFAGVIFSYCINKSKRGFVYSYMVHFGFYVLLSSVFWLGGYKYMLSLI
ncbi:MAG: hypothetical protein WCR40_02010 [Candidatus Paceibacterota bacterium]